MKTHAAQSRKVRPATAPPNFRRPSEADWTPKRLDQPEDIVVPAGLEELLPLVKELSDPATLSGNTIKTYVNAWRKFNQWAVKFGLEALPASPLDVAFYLASMRDRPPNDGGTLTLAAITWKHQFEGWESPVNDRHRAMVQTLRRYRAEMNVVKMKAHPLSPDELRQLLGALDRVSFRLPAGDPLELAQAKLRAEVWVSWFGGRRLDEIVRADESWLVKDGESWVISSDHQKRNPEGHTNVLAPATDKRLCPVTALTAWVEASEPYRGSGTARVTRLFPTVRMVSGEIALVDRISEVYERQMQNGRSPAYAGTTDSQWKSVAHAYAVSSTGNRLREAIQRWCRAAGVSPGRLDRRISGHSARRGLATSLEEAGADLRAIAAHIGWKSIEQAEAYSDHQGVNPLEYLNL